MPHWQVLNRFNGAITIPVWAIYNPEYRQVSIWLFQKLLTASINVIKHLLKIRNVAVIRILYYSLSFRIVCSKQLHFGSSATVSGPEELIQICYIALIKSEYNIKITKIILAYLSCFVVIWNSMFPQHFQTSAVRSKSFVEVQYSSAIDFPFTSILSRLYKASKDRFGRWWTTNVTQTNEEDFSSFRLRHLRSTVPTLFMHNRVYSFIKVADR